MSAEPIRLERRASHRFEFHLPLAVHFDGKTIPGFTQDLSGRGIFFYTEACLPLGATVQLTFTMPSEISLGDAIPVRAKGRVLRASSPCGNQHNGIAVQLDSYEYLQASEIATSSQCLRLSGMSAGSSSRSAHR